VLFAFFGILCFINLIYSILELYKLQNENPLLLQKVISSYAVGIPVPFFFAIMYCTLAFGIWFYRNVRILTVIVSTLAIVGHIYSFIRMCEVFWLPTTIYHGSGKKSLVSYLYPSNEELLFPLIIIGLLIFIIIIMLRKKTKIVFEQKGRLENDGKEVTNLKNIILMHIGIVLIAVLGWLILNMVEFPRQLIVKIKWAMYSTLDITEYK